MTYIIPIRWLRQLNSSPIGHGFIIDFGDCVPTFFETEPRSSHY